ncbi:MAG: hypothetical protein ACRCXD_12295 [Luteolibacter sp.]
MNSTIQPTEPAALNLGTLSHFPIQPDRNALDDPHLRWGWACRALDRKGLIVLPPSGAPPTPGDLALVELEAIGNHSRIVTSDRGAVRLYPGNRMVGVFGNRYATDSFEGEVDGTDQLHILTNAAMIGTVRSKHSDSRSPTRLRLVGFVGDAAGQRINLIERLFRPATDPVLPARIILAVGSGMNSGKTTTVAALAAAIKNRGHRVAACKLTGSVCNRDLSELEATSVEDTRDFSDYGFPSTYKASAETLRDLFLTMMHDANRACPDFVIVEIADGVLQRETRMILADPQIRKHVHGVLLTAPCSLSALQGVSEIEKHGHQLTAVSGIITNSPLFMREFREASPATLASIFHDNGEPSLTDVVVAGTISSHAAA